MCAVFGTQPYQRGGESTVYLVVEGSVLLSPPHGREILAQPEKHETTRLMASREPSDSAACVAAAVRELQRGNRVGRAPQPGRGGWP